ncbi:HPP family protein [Rubripirellula amarantea]|uniref:HPP family protein n=1 Tax=Rubripirellula amarantea TaxID=2527999 RepID=A0A5C5WVR4_9BACT|nr:HPP family protein [Rubripirellula amarantea]TWT54827.1 HPP family protein [Rubripirellula amarantea]
MQALKWLGVELVEVSWSEKWVSAIGSCFAIFCVFTITQYSLPAAAAAGVIASMGATAVLLYAVPHGPLSQPWPVVGGHTISAFIGVSCAYGVSDPTIATPLAVGLAIGAMYQLKCIHPPGGATAFTAVMGGTAVHELGFYFVLYPVLLNTLIMLTLAVAINYPFRWRRYPAYLVQRSNQTAWKKSHGGNELHEEVLAAIRSLDSFVDVSEDDLLFLASTIANRVSHSDSGDSVFVRTRSSSDRWIEPSRTEINHSPTSSRGANDDL